MSTISRPYQGPVPAFAPRLLQLVLLLAGAGSAVARHRSGIPAGPLGGRHLYAGAFYDDKLFRIPEDRPAFDKHRSDYVHYLIRGLLFDKAYWRQKVYLQGKVSSANFHHFKQIDYHGKDFLGLLDGQLGNHLQGSQGASYDTLAPYTDIGTRERTLRAHRRIHADGAWQMDPQPRPRLGAARDKSSYQVRSSK